jgi:hypothetical protein
MYSRHPNMLPPREFNDDLASQFARWLTVHGYTSGTQLQYSASVKLLCHFLDDVPATDVTHLDIRDFLAAIAQRGLKRMDFVSIACALLASGWWRSI